MASLKRIRFSETIAAPVARVFDLMTRAESYRAWASAFYEGSHFEGSWQEGERIHFLAPSGDGMVAEGSNTRLLVDQDVTEEWEAHLREAWPKALAKLNAICEAGDCD